MSIFQTSLRRFYPNLLVKNVPKTVPHRNLYQTKSLPFNLIPSFQRFHTSTPVESKNDNHNPSSIITSKDLDLLSKIKKSPKEKDIPAYAMVMTCKSCNERSAHKISKQAYHNGTVLVTCPGCQNRHLMADHLKIFSDTGITLEDILSKNGDIVNKAMINEDGDIEIVDKDNK